MSNRYNKYGQKPYTNKTNCVHKIGLFFTCLLFSFSLFAQDATKSHVSSDKIFMVTYPANWKENKLETGSEFCINAPGAGLLTICMIRMEINRMADGYENADIHQISDVELKMQKAQSTNLEILNSKFQKKNDHEWWIVNGKLTKGNKIYFTDSYKTIHNGKVYVFTYFSNEKNYEKNKEEANKIINAVEFLTKNNGSTAAAKNNVNDNSDERTNSTTDDRANNSIPTIADKPLWSMKTATGWMKNREGQWISGKNKIQKSDMSLIDTSSWNKGLNIAGTDNFINMEVREVKIGDKAFIVLIKTMQDWRYSITNHYVNPEDLVTRAKFFVVKKNGTAPKPTSANDGSIQYDMQIYFSGFVAYSKNYLHDISLIISEGDQKNPDMKNLGSTSEIHLYYKELKDGKKSRFSFGGAYAQNTPFDPTTQSTDMIDHPGYPNSYFECDKADISGLINLIGKK